MLAAEDLEHFLRRGYLIVPSGVSDGTNQEICKRATEVCSRGPYAAAVLGDNVLPSMPELWEVLEAPPVHKALSAVLGKEYLLHGHRHLHISTPREQMWHKDSYWGFRKMRQHRPRWCMLLYYPQDTTLEMGPTHVLAGSQYWTIDAEGTHRGEDILTPDSGRVDMFVEGTAEERCPQLKQAQDSLTQVAYSHLVEDVPLNVPAGSCVLMHYDLFHRAGYRVSDDEPARFMFKFQFLRTADPAPLSPLPPPAVAESRQEAKCLEDVLDSIRDWMRGEEGCWREEGALESAAGCLPAQESSEAPLDALEQLRQACGEVERISAAYRIGRSAEWPSLLCGLRDDAEAVARCAAYGLTAAGPSATSSLLTLMCHESARVRILAAFAAGEVARPCPKVLEAFREAIDCEHAGWDEVSALLEALACVASRCRAAGEEDLCDKCVELSLPFLQPVFDRCSLPGENACLVVLMAAGSKGQVNLQALKALQNVVDHGHDRYMATFAGEVLARNEASFGLGKGAVGSPTSTRSEEGAGGEAACAERDLGERSTSEKKPRSCADELQADGCAVCEKKLRVELPELLNGKCVVVG